MGIQEVNYKRINTPELLESFKAHSENLNTEPGDLRLNSDYVYKFGDVLLEDNRLNIIDIAIDECDIFYLIDQKQNLILKYDAKEAVLKPIGCNSGILPLKLNTLSAIGIDRDTIYIADYFSGSPAGKDDARLIALAKRDLQIRWVLSRYAHGNPLNKIMDIECDDKGKVYILENEQGRVFCIDKDSSNYPVPSAIYPEFIGNLTAIGIAVNDSSKCYILYKNNADKGLIFDMKAKKGINVDFVPSGIAVVCKQVFIGESDDDSKKDNSTKTIYILSEENLNPLWSYRGSTRKLISDSKGNLYVVNGEGNKLTSLVRKEVNLPNNQSSSNSDSSFTGTYISRPIDSQTLKTQWHRLLLEGEFKKGTQVEFFYYVSDDKQSESRINNLRPGEWHRCISETSSVQGETIRDALFQEEAKGRYLWFKIILSGSETRSPIIKTITIYFPRVSYLDYLPAIYQEDILSRGLLERFLAIFESIFFKIDFTIEHISRFFDAYGAPPEFLSWLGSWLAISMDEDLPEEKKRLFIQNAVSLYKKRGTREGLEESIEIFTGKKPFIIESSHASKSCTGTAFQSSDKERTTCNKDGTLFFPPQEATVKKCLENKVTEEADKNKAAAEANENKTTEEENEMPLIDVLFGTDRFSFCVLLEDSGLDQTTLNRIRRIIEEQKPAHTCYGLKVFEPWFYLDMHTYLGVNTKLTKPEFVLGEKSVIGRDTILDDEEQSGQVERHSRVGIDTVLL